MALRDLPYFPLYSKDFKSDEKLRRCSASAVGVYIFLMCELHRTKEYGKLRLSKRFVYTKHDTKATQTPIQKNEGVDFLYSQFAEILAVQMPFDTETIETALLELDYYGVIRLEGDTLIQPRMVRDGKLSETRRKAVSKRWSKPEGEAEQETPKEDFVYTKGDTNEVQNTENENVYVYNNINSKEEGVKGEETSATESKASRSKTRKATFTPPTLEEVMAYCQERNNGVDAIEFVDYYTANGWVQGRQGKPVADWKACVRVWERNGINPKRHGTGAEATAAAKGELTGVREHSDEQKTHRTTL